MKKSTLISLLALLVALAGVLIALAAYFKKKKESADLEDEEDLPFDALDDEDTEYYEAHLDEDEDDQDSGESCCDCGCEDEEAPAQEGPKEEE